jgi:integrase
MTQYLNNKEFQAGSLRVVFDFGPLKQAVRWQLIIRNPVEAVEPLKVNPREMTLWTSDEAALFLDAAREYRAYALFYFAMSTGLRRGELLGLQLGRPPGFAPHGSPHAERE